MKMHLVFQSSGRNFNRVAIILGLTVHVKPIAIIALGYPAEKPKRFERIELNKPSSLRKVL